MKQSHVKTLRPPPRLPLTSGQIVRVVVSGILVLLAISAYAAFSSMAIATSGQATTPVEAAAVQLYSPVPDWRAAAIATLGQAAHGGSDQAVAQLAAFFQRDEYLTEHGLATARAIASAETRPAYQVLIQSLRLSQPPTRRYAAMAALEEGKPVVTSLLIAALKDPDAGVRADSAELLGYRHDLVAATALDAATYDTDPAVRTAAAWTLGGDLAVWHSLARIQWLRANDPDESVRMAAQLAEGSIRSSIARALGLAPEDVLLASVAPADGVIYAATPDALYAIRDSSHWQMAGALPGHPTALAAGGLDRPVIYLGTSESGPFRSLDSGRTWEQVVSGLPATERLSVTSLVIDPSAAKDGRQVTLALDVLVGTTEVHTTPLGTFRTTDGGNSWLLVASGSTSHN